MKHTLLLLSIVNVARVYRTVAVACAVGISITLRSSTPSRMTVAESADLSAIRALIRAATVKQVSIARNFGKATLPASSCLHQA